MGLQLKEKRSLFFSMDVDNVQGSEKAITPLIEFSEAEGLHTAFFITGRFAEMYPDETRLIHDRGYDVGIHGWDHGLMGRRISGQILTTSKKQGLLKQ